MIHSKLIRGPTDPFNTDWRTRKAWNNTKLSYRRLFETEDEELNGKSE